MKLITLTPYSTGNYPSERVDFAAADKEVYISSGEKIVCTTTVFMATTM